MLWRRSETALARSEALTGRVHARRHPQRGAHALQQLEQPLALLAADPGAQLELQRRCARERALEQLGAARREIELALTPVAGVVAAREHGARFQRGPRRHHTAARRRRARTDP